jgi:nucleotide-binding universal stress UspA family protein
MKEIGTVLFPFDLSEQTSKIMPYVISVADSYNSRIYLLHVVHDLQRWGKVYIPHPSVNMLQKEATEAAERAVDRLCEEELGGRANVQRKVVSGDPTSEILRIIESEDIDLVIMGTHDRKGLENIIMGSVAENVVKQSAVPVMTINPHRIR